jgi:hypothetical protein|tara:strand:+ start:589 stop:783 length:195 start_codon:yes stop_codon:yes gene_type:complete
MSDRTCKKCKHLCHCIEADHEGCKCDGCECSSKEYFKHQDKAEDLSYESNGVIVDDTNECEGCQ